jgi:predicted GNAT superfamily acetyltransferase
MCYSVYRFVDIPPHGLQRLASLDVSEIYPGNFYINRILVPEGVRCEGIGTEMVCELQAKLPPNALVQVHPTTNYGSDLKRLTAFFTRLGFVPCGNGAMQWQA